MAVRPGPRARKALWFIGLWLASVGALGLVAYAIRLALLG